ncbi:MAG: hypothetical protein GKC06_03290 [Methanomicrobiales archaeon]|nr:hypothetical protein [Methanomicrobiales archaeon]
MTGDQTPEQVADRWIHAQRALKAGDQVYAGHLSSMIRARSHDRRCGIRDPLESALFTLLIELVKERDREQEP